MTGRLYAVHLAVESVPRCAFPTGLYRRSSRRDAWRRRGGGSDHVLEPCLAAEVPVLLGAQPIGEPPLGKLDVRIAERLIPGDVSFELAPLLEPLRQVLPRRHFLGIDRLA